MSRIDKYIRIYDQLQDVLVKVKDPVARMASIVALLHNKIEYYFWTGFYILHDNRLLAGPYQGALACIELEYNKGVCWAAVKQKKTIIVPDVKKFPDHIECDSRAKSEIAVPVFTQSGKAGAVLDVDSTMLDSFNDTDAQGLEELVKLIILK